MPRFQKEEGSMQIGGGGILKLLPYQDETLSSDADPDGSMNYWWTHLSFVALVA